MYDFRLPTQRVRSEKDRGSEDALERLNEPTILLATGVHAEALQHFGGGTEPNKLTLLPNGKCGQKNRRQPVQTERDAKLRMSSDLKHEVPIAALIEEMILR